MENRSRYKRHQVLNRVFSNMMSDKKLSKQTNKNKYKFSFVMPVYKVEKYLDETVQSVLDQTIGFEQNCEIIFINDGSPDDSEKICLKYKEEYPENIKYIKQKNKGVSAARNRGLKEVQGKYISFLDSDDKLSAETLEKVYEFFEAHYDEIDLCAIKMSFFGSRTGEHILNWKFAETKIINLHDDPGCVQLSASSAFFKTETISTGKYVFDTKVKHSEDSKFLNSILLQKMRYGVLDDAVYLYRRREEANSAINLSTMHKDWYLVTPTRVYEYLFTLAKKRHGRLYPYFQHLIMYDLQWRFKQEYQGVLDNDELLAYKYKLKSLLNEIKDEIIMNQRNINIEQKMFILGLKNGKNLFRDSELIQKRVYFRDNLIYDYATAKPKAMISILELNKDKLRVEFNVRGLLLDGVGVGVSAGGRFYAAEKLNYGEAKTRYLGEEIYISHNYVAEFQVSKGLNFSPSLRLPDGEVIWLEVFPGRMSRLAPYRRGRSYKVIKPYIFCHVKPNLFVITKYSSVRMIAKELRYFFAIIIDVFLYKTNKAKQS